MLENQFETSYISTFKRRIQRRLKTFTGSRPSNGLTKTCMKHLKLVFFILYVNVYNTSIMRRLKNV